MYDVHKIRRDFPVLQRTVHGKPLVYFDTAASAQRPLAVIEATDRFYRQFNANVHRGVHTLRGGHRPLRGRSAAALSTMTFKGSSATARSGTSVRSPPSSKRTRPGHCST